MRAKPVAFVIVALALSIPAAAPVFAEVEQQPRVTNGRLAALPGASLDATFHRLVAAQAGAGWIGYSVPTVSTSEGRMGHGDTYISDGVVFTNGRLATCGLESSTTRRTSDQPVQAQNPVRLEGPEFVSVLYRVEDKAVQRIRIISPDCEIDAGGLTIQWLENVSGAESVKLLSTFVARTEVKSDRISDGAITAIAMHRDAAADAELERLGAVPSPEFVRKKVTFWMGNARGARGFAAVRTIARDDPSEDVRKSAMFGISQSNDEQSVPELVRFAKQDPSTKVRGEAIFWLGQKAGQRAAKEITAVIENDPDTDVKKRAVFALSQLPKDEGVPLLIDVAKNNKNPVVRKQAMFWLGQSRDPRAVDFFAQLLSK